MKLRCFKIFPLLVGLICVSNFPPPIHAAEIRIGLLVPLTGKLESAGEAVRMGAMMAVDEINLTGGVDGKRLHLVVSDTRSSKTAASRAAHGLLKSGAVLMFAGGGGSSEALEAGLAAEEVEVPFLVTTAADDQITEQGWRYVFRLNAPASEYTASLEEYLAAHVNRNSTAAVIFERSPLGYYGLSRFLRLQRRMGFRIISRIGYEIEKEDFQDEIRRLKEASPDMICLVGQAHQGAAILLEAARTDLKGLFIAGSRELLTQDLGNMAGDAADGLIGAAWWIPGISYPGASIFRESFIDRHGFEPDYHHAQGYAAVWVAADAVDRADTLTPAGIRESLQNTRLMTAYGPVSFESYGRKRQQNRIPSLAVQWDGGALRTLRPRNLPAGP